MLLSQEYLYLKQSNLILKSNAIKLYLLKLKSLQLINPHFFIKKKLIDKNMVTSFKFLNDLTLEKSIEFPFLFNIKFNTFFKKNVFYFDIANILMNSFFFLDQNYNRTSSLLNINDNNRNINLIAMNNYLKDIFYSNQLFNFYIIKVNSFLKKNEFVFNKLFDFLFLTSILKKPLLFVKENQIYQYQINPTFFIKLNVFLNDKKLNFFYNLIFFSHVIMDLNENGPIMFENVMKKKLYADKTLRFFFSRQQKLNYLYYKKTAYYTPLLLFYITREKFRAISRCLLVHY